MSNVFLFHTIFCKSYTTNSISLKPHKATNRWPSDPDKVAYIYIGSSSAIFLSIYSYKALSNEEWRVVYGLKVCVYLFAVCGSTRLMGLVNRKKTNESVQMYYIYIYVCTAIVTFGNTPADVRGWCESWAMHITSRGFVGKQMSFVVRGVQIRTANRFKRCALKQTRIISYWV